MSGAVAAGELVSASRGAPRVAAAVIAIGLEEGLLNALFPTATAAAPAAKPRGARAEAQIPPRFGVVGERYELGNWGYGSPLLLQPLTPASSSGAATSPATPALHAALTSLPRDYGHPVAENLTGEPHESADRLDLGNPIRRCAYRLVIAREPRTSASRGCTVPSIVAVDNCSTQPSEAVIFESPAATSNTTCFGATTPEESVTAAVQQYLATEESHSGVRPEWVIVLDVRRRAGVHGPGVRFTPSEAHFSGFQHRSALRAAGEALEPRGVRNPPSKEVNGELCQGEAALVLPGPLLSLTFFPNDPRKGFNREAWLQSLCPSVREAVLSQGGDAQSTATAALSVVEVTPSPARGMCWGGKSMADAPTGSRRTGARCAPMEGRGLYSRWCVKPLTASVPIRDPSLNANATMLCWHTLLNLDYLDHYAVEVSVVAPSLARAEDIQRLDLGSDASDEDGAVGDRRSQCCCGSLAPGDADGDRWRTSPRGSESDGDHVAQPPATTLLRGKTFLTPEMFSQRTSGTVALPVYTNTPFSPATSVRVLFVQYLVVFPFIHPRNSLRVVRSHESYDRLTVRTLVGHRGLGKTYTRPGTARKRLFRLAENSIASLNAAHQRGCEMVEFDVMLTLDRVPIIFHDALIQFQARQKQRSHPVSSGHGHSVSSAAASSPESQTPSISASLLQSDHGKLAMLNRGRHTAGPVVPSASHTAALRLRRVQPDFASVPVAIHRLTKRQLDIIVTETFTFTKARNMLKQLIVRHWNQILRIYRNRARAKCLRELAERQRRHHHDHHCLGGSTVSVNVESEAVDEFHGCIERRCTSLQTEALHVKRNISLASLMAANEWSQRASETSTPMLGSGEAGGGIRPGPGDVSDSWLDPSLTVPAVFPPSVPASLAPCAQRYEDPCMGVRRAKERGNHFLNHQEDITNPIPTLQELFTQTPSSLRLDLEVKFPFQPKWDANLFLQTDAFEVNDFVDSILSVVFANAEEGREIAFSSFEPDICLALQLKQVRYDVLFLVDTEEKVDLKDYRSFGLENATQFAALQGLSGISINAATLYPSDHQDPPAPAELGSVAGCTRPTRVEHTPMEASDPGERRQTVDTTYGAGLVGAVHSHGLKVWTWGDRNSDHHFANLQAKVMGVDAVITDNVPLWTHTAADSNPAEQAVAKEDYGDNDGSFGDDVAYDTSSTTSMASGGHEM